MNWDDCLNKYAIHLEFELGLSKNSIDSYLFDIKKLKDFIEKNYNQKSPENIKHNELKKFVFIISKEVKASSQSRIISGLKSFFNFLQLETKLENNPTKLLETPKIRKQFPDTLSTDEIDNLINSINSKDTFYYRNSCAVELMYSCGLRVSELISLKFSDLFFDEALIRVRGKGDKMRWVPIAESTAKILKNYINIRKNNKKEKKGHEDKIFLNNRGSSISRFMIFAIIKNAAKKADIKKRISPHTLRHSFATHLVENGAEIQVVQHMMGHSSVLTTERYVHMSQKHLMNSISRFHPRSKG